MTWVLHLSDLHLGASADAQLEDAKLYIEPPEQRLTRAKVLKMTLGTVRNLVDKRGRPDVVAISGDLSTAANQEGFDEFAALLDDFSDILPEDSDRIVAVPGNHDVDWREEQSTRPRYEQFLAVTRDRGLATPLLDGVDFDETDTGVELIGDALADPHVVVTDDAVVVPINSSNWCGIVASDPKGWTEERWTDELAPLSDEARAAALAELRQMRQYDIGRVSRQQFDALRQALDAAGVSQDGSDDQRMRIAVIHHQLLPVSRSEELKAFEAIINLGFVRDTLMEMGFHVVLHGHKHESGLLWDSGRLAMEPFGAPERRMLLVAAPGQFGRRTPVMRALELAGDARARRLRVQTLLGVDSTRKTPDLEAEVDVPLWRTGMAGEPAGGEVIRGPDADTTYSRLRAFFQVRGTEAVHNVSCIIESSADARRMPTAYPYPGDGEERQAWFEGAVRWWQLSDSVLVREGAVAFNHGERIRGRFGDQIDRAAELLAAKPDSTRGIVQLFSPTERRNDSVNFSRSLIPAFSFIQPVLRAIDGSDPQLDCVGYFRKQEMQYWWPINVAELANAQEQLIARLRARNVAVSPGRIVTISTVAHYGSQLPRMAVPEIDLAVEDGDRLWRMAFAVCFPRSEPAKEAFGDWESMLDDLATPLDDTSLRAAKAGPERLLAHVKAIGSFVPEADGARAVARALDDLVAVYGTEGDRIRGPKTTARMRERIERLRQAIADVEAA